MKSRQYRRNSHWHVAVLIALSMAGNVRISAGSIEITSHEEGGLVAHVIDSGFALSHDTFNGIVCAGDGKVYYMLCSESIDTGAQMYSFDPATKAIRHLGDLTEACGEGGLRTVPQGKCHSIIIESGGKLYFSTHVDFYVRDKDGVEVLRSPPPGHLAYPGGHLLSYDLASEKFENFAVAPGHEGIIAMNMDAQRRQLYGLTWPSGYFLRYDLLTRELKNLGKTSGDGESGRGINYRILCRSLALNPEDGSVYFTTFVGAIRRYRPYLDAIETVNGEDMRKDYFGCYAPPFTGVLGYNWRQTVWYPPEKVFYGVHGNSGYLFRFDPAIPRVDVIERITSMPSRRSGMNDYFHYGYLGFAMGPDGHTLYYLTGCPIYVDGKRVVVQDKFDVTGPGGEENYNLVTYDILSGRYIDHGSIFFEDGQRPTHVNSIAVGKDGSVYSLSRITKAGKTRTDLFWIDSDAIRDSNK